MNGISKLLSHIPNKITTDWPVKTMYSQRQSLDSSLLIQTVNSMAADNIHSFTSWTLDNMIYGEESEK